MAAQEAENTAYGIITFCTSLHKDVPMSPEQNRVQQRLPRFGYHLHSAEYVQKVMMP